MESSRNLKADLRASLQNTLPMTFGRVYGGNLRAAIAETQPVAFVEMAVGYTAIVLLNLLFFRRDNWGFFDTNPHPFWLVIIPIAARYGALPGYAAGLM